MHWTIIQIRPKRFKNPRIPRTLRKSNKISAKASERSPSFRGSPFPQKFGRIHSHNCINYFQGRTTYHKSKKACNLFDVLDRYNNDLQSRKPGPVKQQPWWPNRSLNFTDEIQKLRASTWGSSFSIPLDAWDARSQLKGCPGVAKTWWSETADPATFPELFASLNNRLMEIRARDFHRKWGRELFDAWVWHGPRDDNQSPFLLAHWQANRKVLLNNFPIYSELIASTILHRWA